MSESTDRSAVEITPPAPSAMAPPADSESESARSVREYVESLKQGLEKTRLTPELREWFFAQLPPREEDERLLRELQEHGGCSTEEILELLGPEVEPHS
jgi:hypothetical protein